MLTIFYNEKRVWWRSWVNLIRSPPNFGYFMYEGNDHIFSDGIMKFDYEPTIGHPIVQLPHSFLWWRFRPLTQSIGFYVGVVKPKAAAGCWEPNLNDVIYAWANNLGQAGTRFALLLPPRVWSRDNFLSFTLNEMRKVISGIYARFKGGCYNWYRDLLHLNSCKLMNCFQSTIWKVTRPDAERKRWIWGLEKKNKFQWCESL